MLPLLKQAAAGMVEKQLITNINDKLFSSNVSCYLGMSYMCFDKICLLSNRGRLLFTCRLTDLIRILAVLTLFKIDECSLKQQVTRLRFNNLFVYKHMSLSYNR